MQAAWIVDDEEGSAEEGSEDGEEGEDGLMRGSGSEEEVNPQLPTLSPQTSTPSRFWVEGLYTPNIYNGGLYSPNIYRDGGKKDLSVRVHAHGMDTEDSEEKGSDAGEEGGEDGLMRGSSSEEEVIHSVLEG